MVEKEENKKKEISYWEEYVRRSILTLKEELEDPHYEEWSQPTILGFLSQAKDLSEEIGRRRQDENY